MLGVNLIYGAFYRRKDPADLIASLLDELSRERIDLDMIKFSGPAFPGVDNRLMSLQLVERGLTDAAMFTASGEVVQPSEVLHKKPILVERGSFRPATKAHARPAPPGAGAVPSGAERARATARGAGRNDIAQSQPGARRWTHGLPRPDGRPACSGLRRARLAVRAVLPVGRVPRRLHRRDDRDWRSGCPPSGKWPTRSTSRTCPAAFSNRSAGCSSAP